MGCGPSRKSFFKPVQEATGMSKKEIVASYKAFKKEAGGGGDRMKLDRFTKMVTAMNTNKGEERMKLFFGVGGLVMSHLETRTDSVQQQQQQLQQQLQQQQQQQ